MNIYEIKDKLIWFPEEGRGYYPVPARNAVYDKCYFNKYVKYENADIGRCLNKFRVEIVNKYTEAKVLDIGIGCGSFIKQRGNTYGYDINTYAVEWLEKRGLFFDPYQNSLDEFSGITFFDSLEHIERPEEILDKIGRQFVFITIPILPHSKCILDWKHFRKDEYYHYFTFEGFVKYMLGNGFALLELSDFESRCGREDILTFVFRRGQ